MTTQPTQQATEPLLVVDEQPEIHMVKTVSRGRLVIGASCAARRPAPAC